MTELKQERNVFETRVTECQADTVLSRGRAAELPYTDLLFACFRAVSPRPYVGLVME